MAFPFYFSLLILEALCYFLSSIFWRRGVLPRLSATE